MRIYLVIVTVAADGNHLQLCIIDVLTCNSETLVPQSPTFRVNTLWTPPTFLLSGAASLYQTLFKSAAGKYTHINRLHPQSLPLQKQALGPLQLSKPQPLVPSHFQFHSYGLTQLRTVLLLLKNTVCIRMLSWHSL